MLVVFDHLSRDPGQERGGEDEGEGGRGQKRQHGKKLEPGSDRLMTVPFSSTRIMIGRVKMPISRANLLSSPP